MSGSEHIHRDPGILGGKPVVRGTRLPLEFLPILASLGRTQQQIPDGDPQLTPEALQAVTAAGATDSS